VGAGIAEGVNEELGTLVALLAQLLSFVVAFGGFMLVIGAMMALLAPLNASLVRAVAEQQRGGKELELTSVFSTLTQDVMRVVSAASLVTLLGVLGAMACYLPSLLVLFAFGFVGSLVALHRLPPLEAMRANLAHARAHLQWHVMFGLLYMVVLMVGSYIPILGSMFVVAFHVRAYRTMFGDGEAPVLQAA
jgi:hypothetical protein